MQLAEGSADPERGLTMAATETTPSQLELFDDKPKLRDLTGQTAFQRRGEQLRRALGPADAPLAQQLGNLWRKEKGSLSVNLLLLAGLSASGYWWLYPVMWLLPLATWYQLISRIRNIAENAVVPDNDDPLRNTRTTHANPVERLLLAPYWVNYHLEHHLLFYVPC